MTDSRSQAPIECELACYRRLTPWSKFALEAYAPELLQLRVFAFGLFVNRNVGVWRLKESVAGPDALENVTDAARVGALAAYKGFHTETRQPTCSAVLHDAAVVEDLLELGRRRKRSEERA